MRRTLAELAAIIVLSIVLAPPAGAVARSQKFSCKTAGVAQIDPIVVPEGGMSAHLHVFTGNLGIPQGVHDYDVAIQQGTTCTFTVNGVKVDTAGYWVPAMFDANGVMVPIKFVVYYDRMLDPITAFPPNLGQVFGSNLGTFSSKPRSYYGWNCDNTQPLQPSFANVDCRSLSGSENVVTFRAFSPYCLDSGTPPTRNFTGHITYPIGYPSNERCPAGTVTLPRLRVNANYQTKYNPGGYLSSDAAGQHGETAHTDFWNTWQQAGLEALVAQLNG
jgi:Domain of unknown function (DUF1996)